MCTRDKTVTIITDVSFQISMASISLNIYGFQEAVVWGDLTTVKVITIMSPMTPRPPNTSSSQESVHTAKHTLKNVVPPPIFVKGVINFTGQLKRLI